MATGTQRFYRRQRSGSCTTTVSLRWLPARPYHLPWARTPRRLRNIGRRRGMHRRRRAFRLGRIFRIFPGTPQTRRIRRTLARLLLRFFILVRLRQYDFFLGAHDLFAAHLHGFHPDNFITHHAHEINVRRRLTVNPIFVFVLPIPLPSFLFLLPPTVN